jgi:hypothetical protein
VICKVYKSVRLLGLLVFTSSKSSINPITNLNLVYSRHIVTIKSVFKSGASSLIWRLADHRVRTFNFMERLLFWAEEMKGINYIYIYIYIYTYFTCMGYYRRVLDWIYCTLYVHTVRNYRQYSAIAITHTFQFTVAQPSQSSLSYPDNGFPHSSHTSLTVTSNHT